jgi:hypothetical protein
MGLFRGGVGFPFAGAQQLGAYRLTVAGRKGSFEARNAMIKKLRTARYDADARTVTLTPKRAFGLSKAVRLRVSGSSASSLVDSLGRLIDGDHDGQPGGDWTAVFRKVAQ